MTFLEKLKSAGYWIKALRIALLFLILLTVISLLFSNFSDIINLDFAKVYHDNFSGNTWKKFFFTKVILSISYGMFMAHVNLIK
ncbi:MAG: hypothetical protein CSA39_01115 [Flavobacteriales bacterium]|nr:MAG: hypothetical protein CR989_04835 [Flavobacteriales bacterium]PIE49711.1 MAG: hypothetical protein CSA39_01115 [Flavobacteriales bacterium]